MLITTKMKKDLTILLYKKPLPELTMLNLEKTVYICIYIYTFVYIHVYIHMYVYVY